ncbi:MAG TPA: UbiD family decarboxylase [Bryobacteraceae bacterium]|jgi:4-hydroxy-3-polyprenylbenzoate decarboxylase|nr:UbiD family decarboxylase [Bryobacteraceae bacterium]
MQRLKHLRSLREYIDELRILGDIQPIDVEVDWKFEIGAIIRRSYDLRAPAPLFNRVKGYDASGFRVLGAPAALSSRSGMPLARLAIALGHRPDASGQELLEAIVAAHERKPIPHRILAKADAPCKENVMVGDQVDVLALPTPWISPNDGGRYIQTYGLNIARTPDGSWTNYSVNRMMIVDRNRLACLIPPPQHLGIIRSKWIQLGKPMPIVLALGVEPGLAMMGGLPLPENADESLFLAGYFGGPLEMVPAETVDLPVPATAEIIIEGHIGVTDEDVAAEGPMNEYPGYIAHETSPKPLFHISAITYRNHAILPVVAAGPPVEEDHTVTGTMHAAEILYELRRANMPVSSCWSPFESAWHWLAIAARSDWHERLGIESAEFARRIANVVFAGKAGFGVPKILLFEDDIQHRVHRFAVWPQPPATSIRNGSRSTPFWSLTSHRRRSPNACICQSRRLFGCFRISPAFSN